jgi:hypothetical protein
VAFLRTAAFRPKSRWLVSCAGLPTEPVVPGRAGARDRLIGATDDVRIWTVTRSATEIAQNDSVSLTGFEPGLVAYYQVDAERGTSLMNVRGTMISSLPLSVVSGAPVWITSGALLATAQLSGRALVP